MQNLTILPYTHSQYFKTGFILSFILTIMFWKAPFKHCQGYANTDNISLGDALSPNFFFLWVDTPLHCSVATFLVIQLQTLWLHPCYKQWTKTVLCS